MRLQPISMHIVSGKVSPSVFHASSWGVTGSHYEPSGSVVGTNCILIASVTFKIVSVFSGCYL